MVANVVRQNRIVRHVVQVRQHMVERHTVFFPDVAKLSATAFARVPSTRGQKLLTQIYSDLYSTPRQPGGVKKLSVLYVLSKSGAPNASRPNKSTMR